MEKNKVKSFLNFLVLCFLGSFFDSPGSSFFSGGVRVEFQHGSDVIEWVFLGASFDGVGGFWSVQNGLHFVTLEEGLEVGVLDDGGWDAPVLFGGGTGGEVAVDSVEGFEGVFSEDKESSDMSTWGQSKNVQVVDIEDFDAWDVSESSDNTVVLGIYDCWS